ncbi:MAG: DUF5018 domain-containing protein, partial [Bacteroidota bacterium]
SSPVVYTVTAEDGIAMQEWTVSVVVLPNTETDIVSFSLTEKVAPALLDNLLHTISVEVPYGTDVTALVPTIGISAGATIDPASGIAADFSSPVVYTVTAEDGIAMQEWTVSVVVLPNTETDILSLSLTEQTGPATIDNLPHTVSVEVPYGTDVTALVPTIGLSAGATIDPASGVAADFSSPVVYTVIAVDGITTQDWTVTVAVLPNTETDIVSFSLAEEAGPAAIDNLPHTVSVEVPYGTDVTALIPTIGLSDGATILPVNGVATDFSSPVVYTVTAEDGVTMQEWTVTVVILPNTETDIVSFSLAEQTGPAIIDSELNNITIEVVKETDVTALVPTIELSAGANIDPGSGISADFSSVVVYRVTAEDGDNSQEWNVTVTVDPAVSIETAYVPLSMYVYPNPATDKLFVELSATADIYIIDALGRVVITLNDASTKTTIPVSDLERGIYFILMKRDHSREVSKIVLD